MPDVYGAWIDDYDPANPAGHHVVKIHDFDAELAGVAASVLVTTREPLGIARSCFRMGFASSDAECVELFERSHESLERWLGAGGAIVRFTDFTADPVSQVGAVARELGLPADASRDARIAEEIAGYRFEPSAHGGDPGAKYDPVTLMHPDHRSRQKTGGADTREAAPLSDRLTGLLRSRFGEPPAARLCGSAGGSVGGSGERVPSGVGPAAME